MKRSLRKLSQEAKAFSTLVSEDTKTNAGYISTLEKTLAEVKAANVEAKPEAKENSGK